MPVGSGVNQYTGAVEDDGRDNTDLLDGLQDEPIHECDELPEDRFHQADIVSQHMIDTREKQRMEKVRPKPAICFFDVGATTVLKVIDTSPVRCRLIPLLMYSSLHNIGYQVYMSFFLRHYVQ